MEARPRGTSRLSPWRSRTAPSGTPSQCATSWAKLVSCPWPLDWVATTMSMPPSSAKRRSALS